jgi:adenylylsulfate kinase
LVRDTLDGQPRHLGGGEHVGHERQMRSVLLDSANRQDTHSVFGYGFANLGPGEFFIAVFLGHVGYPAYTRGRSNYVTSAERRIMIVAMAGLPATGKSTLSRALAAQTGGVVLDKDEIRRVLFPPAYLEYSAGQDDFCQLLMIETAGYLLERHRELRVFLDGRTFSRAYQIQNVLASADRLQTPWRIIECVCSEETARKRLEDASHPAQNRTYELYLKLKAEFEPIPVPKLVVDADEHLDKCVATARAYLAIRLSGGAAAQRDQPGRG